MSEELEDVSVNVLNDNWIKKYEEVERDYNIFYKEQIAYIQVVLSFVDREKRLTKIKTETIFFNEPNKLTDNELVNILSKHLSPHNKVLSMFVYNLNVSHEDITQNSLTTLFKVKTDDTTFLREITPKLNGKYGPIVFDDTIIFFQDLNSLHIVIQESDTTTHA